MPAQFSILEILLFNLGFVALVYAAIIFQKIGAMASPKFGEEKNTVTVLVKLVKNKKWTAGILLNVISIPYYAFIVSVSSISIVMILQRAGIIVIFIFSVRYLKEKFSRTEVIGLALVYGSIFLMMGVFSTSKSTDVYTSDVQGLVFFAITGVVATITLLSYKHIKKPKLKEFLLAVGAGISGVSGTLALKIIPIVVGRDTGTAGYIFNLFDLPVLGKIMIGIFQPGTLYFFGSVYFWLWIGNFTFNFFLLTIMYQYGRAGVTIPINNNLNFLVSIIFGFFMFAERIDFFSWIGIIMMAVGIVFTSKIQSDYVAKKTQDKGEQAMQDDQVMQIA